MLDLWEVVIDANPILIEQEDVSGFVCNGAVDFHWWYDVLRAPVAQHRKALMNKIEDSVVDASVPHSQFVNACAWSFPDTRRSRPLWREPGFPSERVMSVRSMLRK